MCTDRSTRHDGRVTSPIDGYLTVDLTSNDLREMLTLDALAFSGTSDLDLVEKWPLPIVWDRTRGVRSTDGELVAVHSSYDYAQFPVPGARTPVAGLTWVGVHPGHRRRGLLTAMINDHFARSLARGEAVSALYAAELGIYGRFGYGHASRSVSLKVPRGAQLRDVPDADQIRVRFETVDPERHDPLVTSLHDSIDRPGWAPRAHPTQRESFLHDPPERRGGREQLRIVIAEADSGPVGYALIRRKPDWAPNGPQGVVQVYEVVTTSAAAARALWGAVLDLDLMSTVEVGNLAVDDPLLNLLVDSRHADPRLRDDLWVRLLDLPTALAARRYSTDIDIVLDVADDRLPANAGRWRLVASPHGAEVTPTDTPADLALDVRELGAAYLGGTSLAGLAAAGLVEERTPGTLGVAATAFGWPVAPVCSWVW